ncbi:MAG: alkaline phosphatase family protein [Acidobacteria bacterium]|nr:alkaline phosphatase family protein [Acidobacteriota bacterium]
MSAHANITGKITRGTSLFAAAFALVLFCADPVFAYVGPGAGFAVLSSFLTLLLAFLYSLLAVVTWPLRQIWRLFRRRRAYRAARVKRVVIVGFDGMDPELAARWMDEGKLPNLAALRAAGTFHKLATTNPPISPVAWSTFLTGVNPGKHNIYDFLARDANTYLPYLSSAQVRDSRRSLRLGKYTLPLGAPQMKALRKGKPFWHYLGEAGVFSSVIRVPITFPPEKFAGVLLSGMCVPDLRGSQGTFCFFTDAANSAAPEEGGLRIPLQRNGGGFRSHIPGPDNPLRRDAKRELRAPFTLRPDAASKTALLQLNGRRVTLKQGKYSEWLEVEFRAGWGITARGICRFLLKEISPRVELYATPVNIDPRKPALPISHPLAYSIYLGKLLGPFATLGLAEDTWALNEHVLDDASFLDQCYLIHAERERQFFDALEKTRQGVCVCVFDVTDRVQHMFWRHTVPGHPAAGGYPACAALDTPPGLVIEELYRRMDDLIGRIREKLDRDTLFLVVSDHGFKSFERGFNLNAWLHQNGYLALKEDKHESGEWLAGVDWSRTRAYGMGLNGLYINQQGRERSGIVAPGRETDALKKELIEKLRELADPQSGRVAINDVADRDIAYGGPYTENSPDLILGYAPGFRASWETVKGEVKGAAFEDNRKAWSGDHCMDPQVVPGVLFSNWKIQGERHSIADVAPTILELFGLKLPPHFDGKPWSLSP